MTAEQCADTDRQSLTHHWVYK